MAEKIRTSRGKPLIVLEGFGYVQHKLSSEGKQLFRCVQQRKFKCGGRAISDLDLADFWATRDHALQSVALLPRPSSPSLEPTLIPWAPSANGTRKCPGTEYLELQKRSRIDPTVPSVKSRR